VCRTGVIAAAYFVTGPGTQAKCPAERRTPKCPNKVLSARLLSQHGLPRVSLRKNKEGDHHLPLPAPALVTCFMSAGPRLSPQFHTIRELTKSRKKRRPSNRIFDIPQTPV